MRLINQIQVFKDGGRTSWDSMSKKDKRNYIINFYVKRGFSPIQAAAIVGNIEVESGFDTRILGDKGTALGLFQHRLDRREKLESSYSDPFHVDSQLDFAYQEIMESPWKDEFLNSTDLTHATNLFTSKFERPNEKYAHRDRRIKSAQEAMTTFDPNYQPSQFANQAGQGTTPTLTYEEIIGNRISPADIWEMYKDEPSKAAELIAFKNEYEERLQKEAQAEKQAEIDLQKQALAQAQVEKQMVQKLLTTPTPSQEDYNTQISQPQQPEQPFRFQTDWYIPQMAQEGGTITDTISGNTNDEKVLEHIEDIILPAVKLTGKAPEWVQYRREFEKNNPRGPYIHDNRSMWANRQDLIDKYEREANQYVYDQLLKNNPRRSGESRGEYIQRITGDNPIVQDIIEQNKNRDSSTSENVYMNFARGLLGLSNDPSARATKTALETYTYAPHEREQITNSPLENIGNMADILSIPYNATMGTLYTRGQGQDNYNMASGLSGRVPENRNTMLEIFGDPLNIVGAGAVSKSSGAGKAIQQFGKYATENTPLRNAYKLNPWRFKPNPKAFYRQVDNVTYNEGLESGLIRGKQDINTTKGEGIINLNKAFGDDAYYNKGSLYYKNNRDLPYLFEAKLGEDKFIPKVNGRTRKYTTENTSVRVSKEPLPINDPNITIYKKDWLKGYKEVPKPFKSVVPAVGGAALLNSQYQQNQATDTYQQAYQQGGTISPLQRIKQKFQQI